MRSARAPRDGGAAEDSGPSVVGSIVGFGMVTLLQRKEFASAEF